MGGARQATVRISAEGWWREFVKLALEGLGVGLLVSFVLALAVFIAASHAEAATPPPAAASPGGQLSFDDGAGGRIEAPRVATDVHMDVGGLVARVLVVQRFVNPSAQWREGIFSFPLPENAAVDRMRIETAGRVIEGVVRERGEAKRVYEQAKAEGRKAALVDQERPNLFTTRVAHVGPGEEVAVTIEYQQTLRYDDGVFRLRFPLALTPRYVPGTPLAAVDAGGSMLLPVTGDHAPRAPPGLTARAPAPDLPSLALPTDAVPDADRITPPVAVPGTRLDATLTVDLHAGFALAQLESRYHRARIESLPGHVYRIELADEAPAARDFELVWTPDAGAAPGAAVFAETRDGVTHALLMLVPPAVDTAGRAPRAPREITYVVDTSGSMEGVSIVQAREALGWALDRLAPGDRFNVIEFNSATRSLFAAPMPVDPATVAQAKRFVAGLRARGGTEMLPALTAALAGEAGPGGLRQVVFLTDGAVGNEDALFALIRARLGDRRLYTVGIGPAPNAWFMQKAAQEGRGTYTYIGDVRETAAKMTALFRKLESPVLTDLAVEWPAAAEAWPARLPDLFAGEPLSMTVALPAAARSGDVVVHGRLDGAPWSARLPLAGAVPQAGVGALWGRARIDSLMDAMRHGAAEDATRAEVVRVALAHRLVSRYTSLVAVDVTPSAPPGTVTLAGRVALPLPEGLSHEAILGVPQTATPMPALLASGAAALIASLALLWPLRRSGRGATPAAGRGATVGGGIGRAAGVLALALGGALVAAPTHAGPVGALLLPGHYDDDVGSLRADVPALPGDPWWQLDRGPATWTLARVPVPEGGRPAFLQQLAVATLERPPVAAGTWGERYWLRVPGAAFVPGPVVEVPLKRRALTPMLDHRYELSLAGAPFALTVRNGERTAKGVSDGALYAIEAGGAQWDYLLPGYGWDSTIEFAGDLDGDGRPDFLVNVRGSNSATSYLLLSGMAQPGRNEPVAALTQIGC